MIRFLKPISRGPDHPEFGWTAKQVAIGDRTYLVGSRGWVRLKIKTQDRAGYWRELGVDGPAATAARRASGWFQ